MRKELKELVNAITPLGWKVAGQAGNNHYELCNNDGFKYHTSFSSSDKARALKNITATLKRIDRGIMPWMKVI